MSTHGIVAANFDVERGYINFLKAIYIGKRSKALFAIERFESPMILREYECVSWASSVPAVLKDADFSRPEETIDSQKPS